MAEPYIFLDRDGVILKDVHYLHKIEDIEFMPFAIEGLLKLQTAGGLIIVTNQAGVARGYYSLHEAERLNEEVVHRLCAQGVLIKKSYLCPHHPDFTGACECRKPKIGLIMQAVQEFGIDLTRSIFIGDKDSDTQLGKNCGGTTFLINNGEYPTTIPADFAVKNLMEVYLLLRARVSSKVSKYE